MNFQQVCLTALAFSSSHGASVERHLPGQHLVSIRSPTYTPSELVVERDLHEEGTWGVRLFRRHHRLLQAPIHYPPVRTQEALLDALIGAWAQMSNARPPAPFLTRFIEPPTSSPGPPVIQRVASYLQPNRQRGVSPEHPPGQFTT